MSEAPTPFQVGVMSAMTVIGTSLASLDPATRGKIADAVEKQLELVPSGEMIGSIGEGHLALRALLSGLHLEKSATAQS